MTLPYFLHLILIGLMGFCSGIMTVSKLSVKVGDSVSIPCRYDQTYTSHVKYLCKGNSWTSCKYEVKTNKPDASGKYSISDDTDQRIFTVTINNVTKMDTRFWCAVERNLWDVKERFHLSVIEGVPSLYVDRQEIAAFEGGSVTIVCYNKQPSTKWCRLGGTCVSEQTGSVNGATVTISKTASTGVNVTMSELSAENGGWYYCNNIRFQMPVHVTVHKLTTTTTTTTTTSTKTTTETTTSIATTMRSTAATNTTGAFPTTAQHSSLFTSAEPATAQPTNSTINDAGGEGLQDEHKISTMMLSLIIIPIILLVLVSAAFFGRRLMRRSKTEVKPEAPNVTMGSHTGSDPDVLYSTIIHNPHQAAQKKDHVLEESVTYSTIPLKYIAQQITEPADGSVIYSTPNTQIS